ncbi:glycosyltransferase [Geodermatophilus sp. URMC 61]|uniref:glycosyltransferase n=1 Tax=Geodermatophilus sp. URMC 61 TaxID=3423411 RepID=UPI00406CACD9
MVESVAAGSATGSSSPVSPLRVAHLIHSLSPGGAESVLVELAGVAATAGLELAVVALSPASRTTHADALRARGVDVVQLDLPRWDPRAVPQAVAALRAFGPQVVHTHLKHADIVGGVAGSVLRLPVVSTLHIVEDAPAGTLGRFKRSAGLAVRRRVAARTIALSSAQRRWYQDLTGSDDRLVVLPNGVADPGVPDPAERGRLRAELGVRTGQALVVTASLMRPEKGHRLLLDAVAQLPADLAPVVALAGDGELRAELEARVASDAHLRDRVRFLGYRDDVPDLLAAADLVLHPSLADALPTTVMQALAVGVPVLATDVGGIPDIVGTDAGVLVPTEPGAMAAALTRLLADDALRHRLGAAGRDRFLDRFEAVGWATRLRALYDTVLDEPGRAWSTDARRR